MIEDASILHFAGKKEEEGENMYQAVTISKAAKILQCLQSWLISET